MDREIIFRGKITDNGRWVYGGYETSIEEGDNGGIECYYKEVNAKLYYVNGKIVGPETLGQYTGIKDINKIKIYEGDVVIQIQTNEGSFAGVVKFYEGAWWIDNNKTAIPLFSETAENTVMGNIIDNPEMVGRNKIE